MPWKHSRMTLLTYLNCLLESFDGHNLKILNSDTEDDDYYLKYVAYDNMVLVVKVTGKRPLHVMCHLVLITLPCRMSWLTLVLLPLRLVLLPIRNRLTGDDNTNPQPSFIGKKISSTFFYSNRFGVLSEDNVIFGVANDNYNFLC